MKFVHYFYMYILIFILTRSKCFVLGTSNFEFGELKYLSEKLQPMECFKLLDVIYGKIVSEKSVALEKLQEEIKSILKKSWSTDKSCFSHLLKWQNSFPEDRNIEGRKLMEDVLLSLGRSDLVKYLRKTQRGHFIKHLKRFEKLMENNDYNEAKRYEAVNDEEMSQSKYQNGNGREKNNLYQKFDLDEIDNDHALPTQAIMSGETFNENDYENRNKDVIRGKTREKNFDVYWIILITVIALVIMSICGSGIFFIYRKNCDRFVKGRLCQEWALSREKQNINVCCCGKRRETSRRAYSNVDYMESGWSRKCSKCCLDSKGDDNNEKSRLMKETACVQKCKKLRKKKTHSKTREKCQKKEAKKVARNKCLEKEMKTRKCQRSAISEPSRTDYKEMQNKIVTVPKNNYNHYQCNCTSEETEFIIATKKGKKKKKSGWTSPQLKEKRIKGSKNTEKLFQYDSSSPCSRKTCEWRKIAKGKRHGKNSV